MDYAKVKDNEVVSIILPEVGILKDGSTVSGYNLLDAETLKNEGWLPLTEDRLEYDEATKSLIFDQYVIGEDSVVAKYLAIPIEVPEPTPPSLEERITAMEDAILMII